MRKHLAASGDVNSEYSRRLRRLNVKIKKNFCCWYCCCLGGSFVLAVVNSRVESSNNSDSKRGKRDYKQSTNVE